MNVQDMTYSLMYLTSSTHFLYFVLLGLSLCLLHHEINFYMKLFRNSIKHRLWFLFAFLFLVHNMVISDLYACQIWTSVGRACMRRQGRTQKARAKEMIHLA